jgi:hypothetical protein
VKKSDFPPDRTDVILALVVGTLREGSGMPIDLNRTREHPTRGFGRSSAVGTYTFAGRHKRVEPLLREAAYTPKK